MKRKTILVTGGLGFIGSNLVLHLIESNYFVIILDKKTYSSNLMYLRNIKKNQIKLIISDINNKHQISKILKKYAGLLPDSAITALMSFSSSTQQEYPIESKIAFTLFFVVSLVSGLVYNPVAPHKTADGVFGIALTIAFDFSNQDFIELVFTPAATEMMMVDGFTKLFTSLITPLILCGFTANMSKSASFTALLFERQISTLYFSFKRSSLA